MKKIALQLFILLTVLGCTDKKVYDLIITHATVLDVDSGKLVKNQTICIQNGIIQEINFNSTRSNGKKVIDAKNKLVTPSLIDTHIHPISEFADGNYDLVPDTIPSDSSAYYRENLTDGYLPDGITTVLMMGHPDSWTEEFLKWKNDSSSKHVDVYTCGGALATEDGHTYKGHHRVLNPSVARQKILEYHLKGIEHLKLYWRLKAPEFESIVSIADSLDMKMFAHSGGFFDPSQLTVLEALDFGMRSFEHIAILPCSVFESEDWEIIHAKYQSNFGEVEGDPNQLSLLYILETFKHAEEHKKDELLQLIDTMALANCDISTTIGWVYKTFHPTFFGPAKIDNLSQDQFQRCLDNFDIMMDYVKYIYQSGIPIRIGSDTNPGGKLVLLEMKLLMEYGIPAKDVFRIATLHGAIAMGIEDEIGSLEVDKKANMLIWDKSPFKEPSNLTAGKIIIKDGIIFN
ncbi:MAG: amidohydrolase family protein [Saprospiraceae bacterium]|nr:amidohydrolase family protein [Saprospiraceae bacterium]MDF1698503.1 amidohydrolase family protein [Saprospiraceae bacterium]